MTSLAGSFDCNYGPDPAAALPRSIGLPGGTWITNQFDDLGRLTSTLLRISGEAILNLHSHLCAQRRRLDGRSPALPRQPSDSAQYWKTKEMFGRAVISERLVSGWPGNSLYAHPGLVFCVRFDSSVRSVVAKAGSRFCDWLSKDNLPLPEDICLFRAGARYPTLMSVTHEGDVWLLTGMRVNIPHIVKLGENELREVVNFIYTGPCFCRKWRGRERQFAAE